MAVQSKEPWGPGTPWKNSVNFFTYLRGCLRKAWNLNPIKHSLVKEKRWQIPNMNPKGKKPTVWGFTCEMCGNNFPESECQVDHKIPAGSLRQTSDIQGFVERLLYVTKDDLRLVCKPCNNALAMSEKSGISFKESLAEKQAIAICKTKKDRHWLEERGIVPASNQAKRRQQIVKFIKEGTK